jgi:hypothetical protein
MDLEELINNFSKLVLHCDENMQIETSLLKNKKNIDTFDNKIDNLIDSISRLYIDNSIKEEIIKEEIKNDVMFDITQMNKDNKYEIYLKDIIRSIFMSMLKRNGMSCGIEAKKDNHILDYLY